MPTLRVLARYRSAAGSFERGQIIDFDQEQCDYLLRDSPGSFQQLAKGASRDALLPPASEFEAELDEEDDDEERPGIGAMSSLTASGLVVPDRRGRGGARR